MNIKKIIWPHVSCRPGRVTANEHIFKSGLNACGKVNFEESLRKFDYLIRIISEMSRPCIFRTSVDDIAYGAEYSLYSLEKQKII